MCLLILSMMAMMMMTMMMACLSDVFNYLVGNDGDQDEDGDTIMLARVNVAERTAPC